MDVALGQGQTTPWGQNFDVNRKALSLWSFVASFKKILLNSDFLQFFFMILWIYIALGQGQTIPCGPNFDVNRKALSLWSFAESFKTMLFNSDFIQFFHDFKHVCSPRERADNPMGTKF